MNTDINQLLTKQPILLFDGECGFCNRSIQFFLHQERKALKPGKRLNFIPLESDMGKALKAYFEISDKTDSIILVRDHSAYIKSCAALRITQYMKGLWPIMVVFVIIPPFLRNMVYDFIARHRKRFFGRVQSCALLKNEDKSRFFGA